ncbi:MAG: hypothetical protein ACPGVV_11170 [Croceimicrobium sp.]
MRKVIYVLLILGLGLGILIAIRSAHFYSSREKANPNSIAVECAGGLLIEDVMIEWTAGKDTLIVFNNGLDLQKRYKEYGSNYFIVYHKGVWLAQFHQFKFNNWHGHRYSFHLTKAEDKINIDCIVQGPDSKRWQQMED